MKSEHGSSGGSGKRTRNRHVTAKQHPRRDDAISSNDDTLFDNMAENPHELVECMELLNGIWFLHRFNRPTASVTSKTTLDSTRRNAIVCLSRKVIDQLWC